MMEAGCCKSPGHGERFRPRPVAVEWLTLDANGLYPLRHFRVT